MLNTDLGAPKVCGRYAKSPDSLSVALKAQLTIKISIYKGSEEPERLQKLMV